MNKSKLQILAAIAYGLLCAPLAGQASTIFTINNTSADAFLANGPSGNLANLNFGSAGTLAIAPSGSAKGEFDSVILFNMAAAASQFNTTYGAGNWTITGVKLSLASNFATQGQQPNNALFNTINGGAFGIDWLGNNSWVEGSGGGMGTAGYPANNMVSFDSISTLFSSGSDSLGTFTYTPPGNSSYLNYTLPLDANLTSEAISGGNASLYFFAADNQVSYLFNSREFSSNHPELTLTADAVPEPASTALAVLGLCGVLFRIRKHTRRNLAT